MSDPSTPKLPERVAKLECLVRQLWDSASWAQQRITEICQRRRPTRAGGWPRTVLAAPDSWVTGSAPLNLKSSCIVAPLAPNIYVGSATLKLKSSSTATALPLHTYTGSCTLKLKSSSTVAAVSVTALTGSATLKVKSSCTVVYISAASGYVVVVGSVTLHVRCQSTVARQLPGIYPARWTCWHDEAIITVGGALTPVNNGAQNNAFYAYQASGTNGDTFTNGAFLAAGTYLFYVLGFPDVNRGKMDWYIDGVLAVSGQDWYGAAANNLYQVAAVSVPLSGWHQVKGVANGKNASSSAYYIVLTKYYFVPSSDTTNV